MKVNLVLLLLGVGTYLPFLQTENSAKFIFCDRSKVLSL